MMNPLVVKPRLPNHLLTQTENSYRLRVGNVRVLFEIEKERKIIYVWEIGYRGNIY